MRLRTWQLELAFAGGILGASAAAQGTALAFLAGAAVLASFAHAQVADRLAEREAARPKPSVACHRRALLYFVAKELLWVAFFVATAAYPALLGCALFLLYPVWRRFWRAQHPLDRGAP